MTMKIFTYSLSLFLSVSLLSVFPVYAQEAETVAMTDTLELFNTEDPLHLTLSSDFRNLIKTKFKGKYQPATLTYYLADSTPVEKAVRIQARGEFRRKFCYFPPIKISFKKSNLATEVEHPLKTLKLVTNCKSSKEYEQYVLKEYLTYKLFNALTDSSFKARLARITYVDTSGKMKSRTNYAFFIEHVKHLAARLECLEIESEKVHTEQTSRAHTTLVTVFQFMIGNTDFSVPGLHNVKLLQQNEASTGAIPFMVPYDFDYSGIVNTTYAIPNEKLAIESVRNRLYMGYCRSQEEFQEVFDHFNARKDAVLAVFQEDTMLNKKHRREAIDYIEEFYGIINNPRQVKSMILEVCKRR